MVAPDAIEVRLLGRPAVRAGGAWSEPAPGKTAALLFYLAFHEGWVGRADLVYLFWPDVPEGRARGNLRPLLSHLARNPYARGLERERSRVRWSVRTDLQAFREAVAARRWRQAWELGRHELMAGFTVAGAPEFDAWLEVERAEMRGVARAAGARAAAALVSAGDDAAAVEVLASLHRADPLDEDVARSYLAALARRGARAEALATFESLRLSLADELGVPPEEATLELVESVRSGRFAAGRDADRAPPAATMERIETAITMPIRAGRLVGRDDDVRALTERLQDPACRLLSLVGPGGVGKTRLAIETASRLAAGVRDGARFVDLTTVTTAPELAAAVAESIGLVVGPGDGVENAVLERLRDRRLLLLLDNVEQLVGHLHLIDEVLAGATGVKVLATSRVRLALPEEWVFDLGGLRYPNEEDVDAASRAAAGFDGRAVAEFVAEFGALDLFLRAARRFDPGLMVDEASLRSCARICAHLGGVPLALELAATWLRLLSLDEIEAELDAGSGLLLAIERGGGERHASLRVVFEHSWSLLTAPARQALRALSVFHGGWTREAAWQVAQVGMPALLALLDASLIRREPSGRFAWHPLVGAFAREMAALAPYARDEAAERHAGHFLALVARAERSRRLRDGGERLGELIDDVANLQAAWRWAVARADETLLAEAMPGLWWTCNASNRLRLFAELARETCAVASPGGLLNGRALVGIGAAVAWTSPRRARVEPAEELLRGLAIVEALGSQPDIAFARRYLGIAHANQGRFAQARDQWRRAAGIYRSLGDGEGLAQMLCNEAANAETVEEGLHRYREALAVAVEHGERRPEATASSGLGWMLISLEGATDRARAALERAVELHQLTGYRQFESSARLTLARWHAMAGSLGEARQTASVELRRARASGADDAVQEVSAACAILGWVAFLGGDASTAALMCRQALTTATRTPFAPSEALARLVLARLALGENELDAAAADLERARAALARAVEVTIIGSPWGDEVMRWVDVHLWVGLHVCRVELALAASRHAEAHVAGAEALRVAVSSRQMPASAMALVAAARVYDAAGESGLARTLAEWVLHQPSTPFEAARAARRLSTMRQEPAPSQRRLPGWLRRVVAAPSATPVDLAARVLEHI